MKQKSFASLRVGDSVTLAKPLEIYYGKGAKIPAGSVGVVGAVKCPSVWRESRFFACIDFPSLAADSLSLSGEILRNVPRVSALPEDLAENSGK